MRYRLWDKLDTQKLNRLVKEHGTDWMKIAPMMGRSAASCEHRWRAFNGTDEERAKRDERNRARYQSQKEERSGFRQRGIVELPSKPVSVPDELVIDRNLRSSAPRTLTQTFCGDPPAGWSALDRKRAGADA